MSFSQVSASPFWFPDTVASMRLAGDYNRRRWPLYILAALPIPVSSPKSRATFPTWFLATTFLIDSAKGLLTAVGCVALSACRCVWTRCPSSAGYLLIAVVTVPALGAFAGAAARLRSRSGLLVCLGSMVHGETALAQLVLTPAICYWIFGSDFRALANTPRMIGGRVADDRLAGRHLLRGEHRQPELAAATDAVLCADSVLVLGSVALRHVWRRRRRYLVRRAQSFKLRSRITVLIAGLSSNRNRVALQNFLLLRAGAHISGGRHRRAASRRRAVRCVESEERFSGTLPMPRRS
jgi:hypothetical protein